MALDNLALKKITNELNEELEGAFFDKPFALGFTQFALPYHSGKNISNKGRGTLIINLDGSNPFVTISYQKFTKVPVNTPFFNSLKKLVGCKIKSVSKFRGERIVSFEVENKESLDEINSGFTLIVELFPQKSNAYIIALPYNKVVSLFKEHSDIFGMRYIARNLPYLPPPPRKEVDNSFESIEEIKPYLSRSTFKLFEAYQEGKDFKESLNSLLSSTHLYIINGSIEPFNFNLPEAKEINIDDIFSFFVEDQKSLAKTMNESELTNELNHVLKMTEKKKQNLIKDLSAAKSHLIYKDYGQLLFLYQTNYKKGQTFMDVDGCHIVLDPKIDIIANANKYFKKYHKSKSATETLGPLIEKAQNEIDYLKSKILELDKGCARDIQELKYELFLSGYLKNNKSPINRKNKTKVKYEPHYLSSDSYKIGFGMNALQNEELTFNIAKKDDIFLHVNEAPGAHVIILYGDNNATRLLAAELALFLSNIDAGDVMITQRKNVKKNKDAKGLVNVLDYKLITLKSIRESSLDLFNKSLKQ